MFLKMLMKGIGPDRWQCPGHDRTVFLPQSLPSYFPFRFLLINRLYQAFGRLIYKEMVGWPGKKPCSSKYHVFCPVP